MTDPNNIADVLERAAKLLAPRGAWGHGPRRRSPCMVEAIVDVRGGRDALDFVRGFLGVHSLSEWNDAAGRTQGEAVSALRQAAAKAREQGQ